jgi:hypothetical protein
LLYLIIDAYWFCHFPITPALPGARVFCTLAESIDYKMARAGTRPARCSCIAKTDEALPPLDRNDRSPLLPASATPEPSFEVENLCRGAQSEPQQGLRRRQRDVMAGSAIYLDAQMNLRTVAG